MVFLNTNILLLKLTQDLLGPGTVLGSGVTKMVQELGQTPGGASEEEDGLTVHHLISQSKNVGIPHAPTPSIGNVMSWVLFFTCQNGGFQQAGSIIIVSLGLIHGQEPSGVHCASVK